MNCNYVYRLVNQVFISWKTYVFIRMESPDAKAIKLDCVYVNTHIINIITSLFVDRPRRKSYGGLRSTRMGKGEGSERLERGAKTKGLIPSEQ